MKTASAINHDSDLGQGPRNKSSPPFVFDSSMYASFKSSIKFINAEWGLEIDLIPTEDQFRALVEVNYRKVGRAVILFRDISTLMKHKFHLKSEDGRMIRFLDAQELKIITRSEHVIFQNDVVAQKTFIIQIGKQGLIKLQDLGI